MKTIARYGGNNNIINFKNEQIMKKKRYLMLSSVAAVAITFFVGKNNLVSKDMKWRVHLGTVLKKI